MRAVTFALVRINASSSKVSMSKYIDDLVREDSRRRGVHMSDAKNQVSLNFVPEQKEEPRTPDKPEGAPLDNPRPPPGIGGTHEF